MTKFKNQKSIPSTSSGLMLSKVEASKIKKILITLLAIYSVLSVSNPVWAEELIKVTKSSDGNNIVLTWPCQSGATYNLVSDDKLHEKKGTCQGPIKPIFGSYSYAFTPQPTKFTLEIVAGESKKIDTVTVNFGNESAGQPPVTRQAGGETAGGLLQVTSPDFGGPFTNIGDYVVAVIQKILPIFMAGAVLVIVWAGIRFITSQGNPDATTQAKSLLEGAILGLLTLFLVGVLLSFLT